MGLTQKETARWLALKSVCGILDNVSNSSGVAPSYAANKFISDEDKYAANKEFEKIRMQLHTRLNKLDVKIGQD
jgi:hypothetical protein